MSLRIQAALLVACIFPSLHAAEPGAARLKKDVQYLASDKLKGRGVGTPGLESAAEYIAHRFWQIGLQPGTAGGWFQRVPVTTVEAGDISLTIGIASKKLALSNTSAKALVAGPVSVTDAEVVKLDRDYLRTLKRGELRGKVGITSDFGIAQRSQSAAPELVVVASAKAAEMMTMMPADIPGIEGDDSRFPITALVTADPDFSKLVDESSAGLVKDAKSSAVVQGGRRNYQIRNVLGLLPGSDPVLKNTYIIVSAHYDHLGETTGGPDSIRNGANDDASGVAAMLGVAQRLIRANPRPRRSILFAAWTGEESGGLGSRFYARHPIYPLQQTVANINIEQIGRYDGEGGAGPKRVFMTGYGYSTLGTMMTTAAQTVGVEAYAGPDAFFARSDNVFLAEAGVPAHTIGASLEFPDYHKVSDSADKLDYDNMAVLTRAVAATVQAVANSSDEPAWSTTVKAVEPYRKARGKS
ncbi:MAG: M20/M25/M40 family metallo-hydrolase [Bryobacteraceae bacterium]|nr:M20/M25/M40 family metallo-hydrolase [Bryobacteraceae bacterium]